MNRKLYILLLFWLFAGCKAEENQSFHIKGAIDIDGRTRYYVLNLPPNYYNGSDEFPLVIGLHGGGGSGQQFETSYQFSEKADKSGFLAVYPDGVRSDGPLGVRTWNAGSCCDYAVEENVDDVNFIRILIEHLSEQYKIDANRVYATGMSNGGMLAYRLACEISDKIAAIAVVSGTMLVTEPCNPSRAVPVLHIHSAIDQKVPYQGGVGIRNYYFPPIDSGLVVWSELNGCTEDAKIIFQNHLYQQIQWGSCQQESVVELYLTQDGGHAWPGGSKTGSWADEPSQAINANDVIWNFFQQHQRL